MEGRVVQTIYRLNVVNNALLKADSESDDARLRILNFAEYVLRGCYPLFSELLSGN
jgi:hypothetical protein